MQGPGNFPILQALFQENLSGALPKSAVLALQPTQRSSNSSTASDADIPIIGGVFKDGRYSWLSRGSKLVIISSKSNSVISIYDFNQTYRELRFVVTACCACENLLIVGLKGQDGRGCIAVYNPLISKVVKAIDIPYPVSALEMVTCRGGAIASTRCLCKNLRWMFGVIAVGTDEGHLYLVDLRFDSPHSLETVPSQIEIVSPSLRNVPKTRENVAMDNAHLAFELQASCHGDGVFNYALPDDETLDSFYPSDATVTALLYEPRVASLFVGFSFGQFQIISLQDNMNLVHSSDFGGNSASILKLAFQEPENDPRKFCYLWVARGNEKNPDSAQRSSEPLTLSMFQLAYAKKEIISKPTSEFESKRKDSAARVLYKNFEVCNKRFEHPLGPRFASNAAHCRSSNLLMCSSIEKFSSEATVAENTEDEETDFSLSPSTSFCVFGWQSLKGGRHSDRTQLSVIVFDINKWYMAQMPQCFHGDEGDSLFAGFWSFENERRILADDEEILAMHIPSDKVRHFESGMRPLLEKYIVPSACSFSLHFITNQSLCCYSLFGYQQQVLNSASELKSMCLVNPQRMHDDMLSSELYSRHTRNQAFTPDMMRENILTTALEHGQIGFLLSVVRDLASGHLAACGCTLRFVMDWAWKSVANVKNAVDELCVPIFDCTTSILDSLVRSRLQFNSTQIHHLCIVFQKLMEYTEDASDQSKEELGTKLNVVSLISQYLKVVQWFIGNGLLPEQLDNVEDNDEIMTPSGVLIYKYTRLRQVFDQRRSELKRLKAPDLLLIDGWVEEIGDPLTSRWLKEEGGKTTYPPPSFMTLLDMYYLDCVDVITKHCLVMYLLYDVLAMFSTLDGNDQNPNADLHESQRERLNNIATFMESFSVSTGIIKLTQGFWLLDHKNFQDALNAFLDPDTSRPYSTRQERRILRAFLYQGHPAMALKYISARHPRVETLDDARMHITIFVKTREPLKAWNLVQMSAGQHDNKELFTHLFTLCQKHSQLDQLLKLPFSAREEEMVIDYLKDSDSLEATQILVLFYLQQSKYVEAIKLHSQTKHTRLMRDQSEESRRRNAKLDHIVQSYSNLLPKIEREITFSGNKFLKQRVLTKREMCKPASLSAILHPSANVEPSSHAGRLMSFMDKMDQKTRSAQDTVVTPLRRRRIGIALDTKVPEINPSVFPTVDPSKRRNSFEPQGIFGNRSSFGSPTQPASSRVSRTTGPRSSSSKLPISVKERRLSSLSTASMLLQTPPITRRRPSIGKHLAMQSIQTPQSILKVKKLFQDKGGISSLSGVLQTSLRQNMGTDRSADENTGSESVISETSHDIKREIPTISTPSAKLFNQTLMKKFKLENAEANREEMKAPLPDTPKVLRFAGIDSSANDSGLSPALSPPVEQVAGLPNLTPIHVQAEDTISDGEMEVDITGDEINDQDQEETIEAEIEQTKRASEISEVPEDEDQVVGKIELSDVEEEDEDENEQEEEDSLETAEPLAVPQFSEPVAEGKHFDGSDEVICLDSSSDEEPPQQDQGVPKQEEELVQEVNYTDRQQNESLRLVLTSSDESLEEDENKIPQEEDGYGTEEFAVEQEESLEAVILVEENRSSSPISHRTVVQEECSSTELEHKEMQAHKPSETTQEAICKKEEELADVKEVAVQDTDQPDHALQEQYSESEKELSDMVEVENEETDTHQLCEVTEEKNFGNEKEIRDAEELEDEEADSHQPDEVVQKKDPDVIGTKDALLSQTSPDDQEHGQYEIAPKPSSDSGEQLYDTEMSPELFVPHLTVDPQEDIEIQISDDEANFEQSRPEEGESLKQKENEQEDVFHKEDDELKLRLSSSEQETSDENTEMLERQGSVVGHLKIGKEDLGTLNTDEATSDYQSMSTTKMEEEMSSPDQERSNDIQEKVVGGMAGAISPTSLEPPEEAKTGEAVVKKTPEKEFKTEMNFSKIEVTVNPSTPVLDRIQTEPTFVLSPPTTRKSKRTRQTKATQYTPRPVAPPTEKKVPKSPSRVTRSATKQTQDGLAVEPTFLFSPPQTRKRPGGKKEQSVAEKKEPMATLSPSHPGTKRTRIRAKSPESDQSSTSQSPVRRSQRKTRSHSESKLESSPEPKPAPSTPSRKTRQSPARKAPSTPTRSSSRLKAQSKLNLSPEPENPLEPKPVPVAEEELPVSKRTRRRKTSVSSDMASSGTESETAATPSRRSTRRTAKSRSSPVKESVKLPELAPVAEEDEDEGEHKKKRRREAPGKKALKTTRSAASYPTRMRRKAKIFTLEE